MKRLFWLLVCLCLPLWLIWHIQPPLAALPSTTVVIAAAYYDSYESGDPDEAV